MNYEEMSDFDINQAVTCEVHRCHDWAMNKDGSFYHCGILGESYVHQDVIDYCNNPSDAWPIIFGNEISLVNVDDALWVARYGSVYSEGKNPLRAAMIVFLIMQEQAK